MKNLVLFCSLILNVGFYSPFAFSLDLNGISISDTSQIENKTLQLQGAGVRQKVIIDVYVGAFYAEEKLQTTDLALNNSGYKRMWFCFLRDVPSAKYQESWQESLTSNNTLEMIIGNQTLVKQFIDLFDKEINKGDIMTIDYLPSKGTRVSANGSVRGIIPGEQFYRMLLSVWMGPNPPSQKFQRALLSN